MRKSGRAGRANEREGKTRWWTHASGCITTTTDTTTTTVNVIAMTNLLWAQWPIVVVACLFCFTNLLQDAKRKQQSGSGNGSEINEWRVRPACVLLTLKLAGKCVCVCVCSYWFCSFSLVVIVLRCADWLERTVRIAAGNNNKNNNNNCHTLQGSKLDWMAKQTAPHYACLRVCVCVRILTKKRVNKWDAKQNEFLQTLSLMMTMMSRPGWRPLFFSIMLNYWHSH